METDMLRKALAALMLCAACIPATNDNARAQGVSPNQMFGCNQSANYDASTSGATRLVVGATTKGIYVCGWNIMPAGTVSVQLVYGTQVSTPCDTGQTPVTPA